jgi:hypothetical protein
MHSIGHMISFPTPTHTYVSGNHSNGYGRSKTALVRSYRIARKLLLRRFKAWKRFQNLAMIMIFKVGIFLSRLGSLMICTHDLTVLTKTKEMTCYCGLSAFGGKIALNT